MKNKLQFTVNKQGNAATWRAADLPLCEYEDGDFWRLMADDGYYREMQISSADQVAKSVTTAGNVTTVVYEGLVSREGRRFDTTLTLRVTDTDEGLLFDAEIENRDKARMNELEYPYVSLATACSEDRATDVLYRPNGLGECLPDPWKAIATAHTEYMSADYEDIKLTLRYPHPASMSWFGLETGGHFLYLGRHDPRAGLCCLLASVAPRGAEQPRLSQAICHYPFVKQGEKLAVPTSVVSLSEGDWREGAARYRAFAEGAFYTPTEPPKWVREMRGWQRIILRHQYGEIFWKYEDLPRLYLEGKESGLETLMVFGWWRGRFDNGYPTYEADPALGGAEGLRAAIAEVQRLGGRVILYNNGVLIDKNTDFYRELGTEISCVDIDGNCYEDHYKFENNGTVLRNYGYKSFTHACHGDKRWRDKMVENGKYKLSFSPDSIFYDQWGVCYDLCFNEKHDHGARPDDMLRPRQKTFAACRALLSGDQALGTEWMLDAVACKMDYIHGCGKGTHKFAKGYEKTVYPALYLHTFPETVSTNRLLHDCRDHWRDELNYTYIYGLRFDVSIYRGRRVGIKGIPAYAAYVAKLNALRAQHHDFFFGNAKFVYDTVPEVVGNEIIDFGELVSPDGRRLLNLANYSDTDATVKVKEKTHTVPAHGVLSVLF